MEQLNLNWHTFNDHLKVMMQNLLQSNDSTDITLVCEDKTKFKAHKLVLKACSPVFQSIINELPQINPVIYLKGIQSQEMKSILQFMYLGQATFYQERMNDFLSVAKSLEIKEISKDVECDQADLENNQECDAMTNDNGYEVESMENLNTNTEDLDQADTKLKVYDYDSDVRTFCKQKGIYYQSFWTLTANPHMVQSQAIANICKNRGKTPAQVWFRYLIQRHDIIILTGTKNEEHMKHDLDITNWQLEESEMKLIDDLF